MKTEKPEISIVIGVRNRDKQLFYCLKTLLNQTIRKSLYEIIVVNYGGPRSTKKIVESFHSKQIHYLYVEEKGTFNEPRAKNIGVKQARGSFILCANADILFDPRVLYQLRIMYLKKDLKKLYQLQRLDLHEKKITSKLLQQIENDSVPVSSYSIGELSADGDFQGTFKSNWLKIRGFDERMTGWGMIDRDLAKRMRMIGVEQVWLDNTKIKIYHQPHQGRAPFKENINLLLKNANSKPIVNSKEWGEIKRKPKVILLISENKDESLKNKVRLLNAKNDEFVFSSKFCGNGKINIFFLEQSSHYIESGYDIIAHVEDESFVSSKLLKLVKKTSEYDAIFSGQFTNFSPLQEFLMNTFFFKPKYYKLRIFNSRIATVLQQERYFSKKLYPILLYDKVKKLEHRNTESNYFNQREKKIALIFEDGKSRDKNFPEKYLYIIIEKFKRLIRSLSNAKFSVFFPTTV